jgi:hypothetical protein
LPRTSAEPSSNTPAIFRASKPRQWSRRCIRSALRRTLEAEQMTYRDAVAELRMKPAIEYLRKTRVTQPGQATNKSPAIAGDTWPRVEQLIYVNSRSVDRITMV